MLKLIAQQLRQPSGLLGHVWGRLMNRANAGIVAGAIDALPCEPHHHVLEIGFGGGSGLQRLLDTVRTGPVTGVELSDVMLSKAEKRFTDEIRRNRLRLLSGSIEQLPLDDTIFDGAVTINTVYFWTEPKQALAEVLRVLKPGGSFVIGIRPPDFMRRLPTTRHGFTIYEPEELERMLNEAGFTGIRSESSDEDRPGYICVVGRKPA